MQEQLSLGPTPTDEKCESLGPDYSEARARKECRAFINQLGRVFGPPPEGGRFRIKSNSHDAGVYLDVEIEYDEYSRASVEYAYKVEGNTPQEWDAEARTELGLA